MAGRIRADICTSPAQPRLSSLAAANLTLGCGPQRTLSWESQASRPFCCSPLPLSLSPAFLLRQGHGKRRSLGGRRKTWVWTLLCHSVSIPQILISLLGSWHSLGSGNTVINVGVSGGSINNTPFFSSFPGQLRNRHRSPKGGVQNVLYYREGYIGR